MPQEEDTNCQHQSPIRNWPAVHNNVPSRSGAVPKQPFPQPSLSRDVLSRAALVATVVVTATAAFITPSSRWPDAAARAQVAKLKEPTFQDPGFANSTGKEQRRTLSLTAVASALMV